MMKQFELPEFFCNASEPRAERISVLINAYYFSYMHVLVMERAKDYRLVVIDQRVQMIEDKNFANLKEAQEYFEINYTMIASASSLGEMAEWTPLYMPNKKWLDKLLGSSLNINKDQVGRVSVNADGKHHTSLDLVVKR